MRWDYLFFITFYVLLTYSIIHMHPERIHQRKRRLLTNTEIRELRRAISLKGDKKHHLSLRDLDYF